MRGITASVAATLSERNRPKGTKSPVARSIATIVPTVHGGKNGSSLAHGLERGTSVIRASARRGSGRPARTHTPASSREIDAHPGTAPNGALRRAFIDTIRQESPCELSPEVRTSPRQTARPRPRCDGVSKRVLVETPGSCVSGRRRRRTATANSIPPSHYTETTLRRSRRSARAGRRKESERRRRQKIKQRESYDARWAGACLLFAGRYE